MNAIEYGSQSDPSIPIDIEVDGRRRRPDRSHLRPGLVGRSRVRGPDIEEKLAGEQKPRGWGLFLIKHMVDAMEVGDRRERQTVILIVHLEGAGNASEPV